MVCLMNFPKSTAATPRLGDRGCAWTNTPNLPTCGLRPTPDPPHRLTPLSEIKADGSVTTLDQGAGVPSPFLCPRSTSLPQVAPRLRPSPCMAPTTPAPPQACYDSKPPPTREFPSFPPHSDHPVGGGHRGDYRCGPGRLAWLRI